MAPMEMEVTQVGDAYHLKREQWRGRTAKISNDEDLLNSVRQYTWTYNDSEHPYLRCSKNNRMLHQFVLDHIYGEDVIKKLTDAGNIIEHLDNDGLNCTYENLHIISSDMNKAKAFTIDKANADQKNKLELQAYIIDVYYLHDKKQFQVQVFCNEDIYFTEKHRPVDMLVLLYDHFNNLYIDWFYLLNERENRKFDISKLHASMIYAHLRPMIEITDEEKNRSIIVRNGVPYLNLDANKDTGGFTFVTHTARRNVDD